MRSFCELGKAYLNVKVSVTTKTEIWKYFTKLSAQYSNTIIAFEEAANDGTFVSWIDEITQFLCAVINFDWEGAGDQVSCPVADR